MLLLLLSLLTAPVHAGEIALTFDDIPRSDSWRFTGPERTRHLIEALRAAGVTEAAMFSKPGDFARGEGKARVEAYAAAGHAIGNHSFDHPDFSTIPIEEAYSQLERSHEALKGIRGFHPWFRFPYSREGKDAESRRLIRKRYQELGYELGYFTVDAADWYWDQELERATKKHGSINLERLKKEYVDATWKCIEFNDRLARKLLGRSPKHVLILHETDLNTLTVVDLAAMIRKKGWKIIPASEAFADPLAKQVPKSEKSQFRLVGLATDQGYKGAIEPPEKEEAYIDRKLKKVVSFNKEE